MSSVPMSVQETPNCLILCVG